MKIAVCISGELRTLNVEHFKEIFKDVDFFIHTNKNDDRIQQLNPKSFLIENLDFKSHPYYMINYKSDFDVIKNSSNRVHEILSIEDFKIKNDYNFEVENPGNWSSKPFNLLSMFYSIMQSNLLKKNYEQINNFTYDVVLRVRADITFLKEFDISEFKDSLYVFNTPQILQNKYINDHFAASNSKIMDIYSSLYLHIPRYYYIDYIDLIPEILLKHHIDINKINYKEIVTPYIVKRDDGRRDVHMNI